MKHKRFPARILCLVLALLLVSGTALAFTGLDESDEEDEDWAVSGYAVDYLSSSFSPFGYNQTTYIGDAVYDNAGFGMLVRMSGMGYDTTQGDFILTGENLFFFGDINLFQEDAQRRYGSNRNPILNASQSGDTVALYTSGNISAVSSGEYELQFYTRDEGGAITINADSQKGYETSTFKPRKVVERTTMQDFLTQDALEVANLPEGTALTETTLYLPGADAEGNAGFYPIVTELGLTESLPDGAFGGNSTPTRAEFLTLLYSATTGKVDVEKWHMKAPETYVVYRDFFGNTIQDFPVVTYRFTSVMNNVRDVSLDTSNAEWMIESTSIDNLKVIGVELTKDGETVVSNELLFAKDADGKPVLTGQIVRLADGTYALNRSTDRGFMDTNGGFAAVNSGMVDIIMYAGDGTVTQVRAQVRVAPETQEDTYNTPVGNKSYVDMVDVTIQEETYYDNTITVECPNCKQFVSTPKDANDEPLPVHVALCGKDGHYSCDLTAKHYDVCGVPGHWGCDGLTHGAPPCKVWGHCVSMEGYVEANHSDVDFISEYCNRIPPHLECEGDPEHTCPNPKCGKTYVCSKSNAHTTCNVCGDYWCNGGNSWHRSPCNQPNHQPCYHQKMNLTYVAAEHEFCDLCEKFRCTTVNPNHGKGHCVPADPPAQEEETLYCPNQCGGIVEDIAEHLFPCGNDYWCKIPATERDKAWSLHGRCCEHGYYVCESVSGHLYMEECPVCSNPHFECAEHFDD